METIGESSDRKRGWKYIAALGIAGAGLVAVAVLKPDWKHLRALGRRTARRVQSRVRYEAGILEGARYRASGATPDPDVADDILADRVRSALGRVEKQRDLPRAHVMVERGVCLLHGTMPSAADKMAVEDEARAVPGVRDVRSVLRVGSFHGDTRPSYSRTHVPRSPQKSALIDAAVDAGGFTQETGRSAVGAVLSTLAERLPPRERAHLLGHLPADVRALIEVSSTAEGTKLRTVPELSIRLAEVTGVTDEGRREQIVVAVIGALRDIVPEEVADVEAVLPEKLKHVWARAPHRASAPDRRASGP
ncbi:MAG: DUF2267 domain-containing protein [Actinomycetota bacterium]